MDGSLPSVDAFAPPPDEVSIKLRGRVWEHSGLARGAYASVLDLGRWLSARGVTPNSLTYGALALALAAGVATAFGEYLTAAGLMLLSGALDLLDGVVARAAHRSSRFGALLDSTVDRLADALPLMGLVVHGVRPWAAAVLVVAMMTGFAVSYVRARAEGLGIALPPLFMRRPERLAMLLVALVAGAISLPGFPGELVMLSIVGLMAVLSLIGAVWALRAAYVAQQLDEAPGVNVRAAPTPSRP